MKKLTIVMIILDLIATAGFIVTYCVPSFRNTIIATALNTKTHQWIAYTFYSEEQINYVLSLDSYIPLTDEVNLDSIVIDTSEKDSYDNEYDEQILTRDPGNEDYKLINVKVGGYDAHLVAIYDPSKVKLIHSKVFNSANNVGLEQVLSMCKRYDGSVCINGGGFLDAGTATYDIPLGYLIENGKVIWSDSAEKRNLIGFTYSNKLLLTNATGEEAIAKGMRDALEFGPFLIVNGKALKYSNSDSAGGYSRAARVAVAQRKDGVVLFLVTEGTHTGGPNLGELIELLQKYGAYNAANLDGGTSSTLIINNKLINNPKNVWGQAVYNGRYVVSGFGLLK
jgi:exopolysaccharide biosynthesis protein